MTPILIATENACYTLASSSISSNSFSATPLKGIGNVDAPAPAVISIATNCEELYFNTNVWSVDAEIKVKEMAADTSAGTIGQLAETIFDPFSDLVNRANNLGNAIPGYFVYTIIPQGSSEHVSGDAWEQSLKLKVICCLTT